eukprot:14167050-Alexandrium_andersonii.AAC.1
MYKNHPKVFRERFLGGQPEKIKGFWKAMRNHPAFQQHPMQSRPDYSTRCVPLGIHGDGVPVSGIGRKWSKSCLALSWQSMLATGSTLEFNMLITVLYKLLCVKSGPRDTMQK